MPHDKSHRPPAIQQLLVSAIRRRWRHLALERLETVKPKLPLGKRFWALGKMERSKLAELLKQEAVRKMVTTLQEQMTTLRWSLSTPHTG